MPPFYLVQYLLILIFICIDLGSLKLISVRIIGWIWCWGRFLGCLGWWVWCLRFVVQDIMSGLWLHILRIVSMWMMIPRMKERNDTSGHIWNKKQSIWRENWLNQNPETQYFWVKLSKRWKKLTLSNCIIKYKR
jgi:hypothetical protein